MVHPQQSKSHRSKELLDIFPTISCSNAAEPTCLQKTWSRLVILRVYSTLLQIKFLLVGTDCEREDDPDQHVQAGCLQEGIAL